MSSEEPFGDQSLLFLSNGDLERASKCLYIKLPVSISLKSLRIVPKTSIPNMITGVLDDLSMCTMYEHYETNKRMFLPKFVILHLKCWNPFPRSSPTDSRGKSEDVCSICQKWQAHKIWVKRPSCKLHRCSHKQTISRASMSVWQASILCNKA